MLHLEQITEQIILVKADSQEELGRTFLRFQEHYESPEFKEKVFTLGQFRQWYAQKYGAFTYIDDWTGFNIPSYVLNSFKDGLFDPLTEEEKNFVTLFKDRKDKFYIIGTQDGNSSTLDHEICHALFYINDKYRVEVTKLIENNKSELKEVYNLVNKLGYHKTVHLDEVHAYCSANLDWLKSKGINIDVKIHTKLRAIKTKHFK